MKAGGKRLDKSKMMVYNKDQYRNCKVCIGYIKSVPLDVNGADDIIKLIYQ